MQNDESPRLRAWALSLVLRSGRDSKQPKTAGSEQKQTNAEGALIDQPRDDEPKSAFEGDAQDSAQESADPISDRLSRAIDRASEAGQWTVVERLAAQLERHQLRQLEAQADNVARLPDRRKKPGAS